MYLNKQPPNVSFKKLIKNCHSNLFEFIWDYFPFTGKICVKGTIAEKLDLIFTYENKITIKNNLHKHVRQSLIGKLASGGLNGNLNGSDTLLVW